MITRNLQCLRGQKTSPINIGWGAVIYINKQHYFLQIIVINLQPLKIILVVFVYIMGEIMNQVYIIAIVAISSIFNTYAYADISSVGYVDRITKSLTDTISTKADTASVVHISDNETITGTKTFTNTIISTNNDVILDSPTASIRSTNNPFFGLYPDGKNGEYKFYVQAIGNTMYLGPTSTRAVAFDHDTGAVTIPTTLNVKTSITQETDVAESSNNNQVATTKWTNKKIDSARRTIPVGGPTATEYAEIWIE